MKIYLIYYEPFSKRLPIAYTALVAAENQAKAQLYFRAIYQGRILKVKPIKQF